MTLDELKALKGNGMAMPTRVTFTNDPSLAPEAPTALVLDMSCNLTLVDETLSSERAAELLKASGAAVNPVLFPTWLNRGDTDGAYSAAYAYAALSIGASAGLLSFSSSDFYHYFTDATKELAKAHCTDLAASASIAERINYLFEKRLELRPVPSMQ